jgi:adenylyl cyclase-associated protein
MSAADLASLVARLEAVTSRLEAAPGGGSGVCAPAAAVEVAPFVVEYDDIINGELATYVAASAKVGGCAEDQAKLFEQAFKDTRELLEIASGSKKPDGWPGAMPDNVMGIIQKVGGNIGAIGEIDGFKTKQLEYTKALSDGAQALSWVVMDPTPAPHCRESCDSMWFNGQKVVMKCKGSDQNGVDWANAIKELLTALGTYVKKNHTTGVAWNPRGGDAASFVPGAAVAAAAPAAAAAAPAAGSGDVGASVSEFDGLIGDYIDKFVDLSTKIGGPVAKIGEQVGTCFKNQRAFLEMASQSKKPAGWPGCAELLEPMSSCMMAISEINDIGDWKNACQFMHEGIQVAAWVCIEPTPGPHVKASLEAAMFYGNKVMTANKNGGDPNQVDWVKTWQDFGAELEKYVKRNHTTGVTWNPKGGEAASAPAPAPAAKPKAGGPPPPPPGPAPKLSDLEDKRGGSKQAAPTGALFAELNKGGAVTQGLRKVTKQKAASSTVTMKKKATKVTKKMGTPKLDLDGRKWNCEYYVDDRTGNLVISECTVKESITIFRCINSVIQIKGKINAILLDDCDKTSIVCSTVVSSIDVVNCKSVEVQATGKVPTILVDKTDGCQLYLGPEAIDTTIITSKTSEVNVSTPGATEEEDDVEQALPEQFSNMFKDGSWHTSAVTHG